MSAGLVRTTTYFDQNIFNLAKRQALEKGVSFYEFINSQLAKAMNVKTYSDSHPKMKKPFKLEDVFGPPLKLHLKKHRLTRADYYDE